MVLLLSAALLETGARCIAACIADARLPCVAPDAANGMCHSGDVRQRRGLRQWRDWSSGTPHRLGRDPTPFLRGHWYMFKVYMNLIQQFMSYAGFNSSQSVTRIASSLLCPPAALIV